MTPLKISPAARSNTHTPAWRRRATFRDVALVRHKSGAAAAINTGGLAAQLAKAERACITEAPFCAQSLCEPSGRAHGLRGSCGLLGCNTY